MTTDYLAGTGESVLALHNAIVDAAIQFRLANRDYDECCERAGGADDELCEDKLVGALERKTALFALVDRLLGGHPLDA